VGGVDHHAASELPAYRPTRSLKGVCRTQHIPNFFYRVFPFINQDHAFDIAGLVPVFRGTAVGPFAGHKADDPEELIPGVFRAERVCQALPGFAA
jgi:hypothetical protein